MTWNPTTGCNKVSAGCKFCYAERMSKRLKAMGQKKYQNGFQITTHPEALKVPYTWKKPQLVFVNSMSDLFHPEVPLEFIKDVFKVMQDNPKHRFQLLTKRADILAEYSPLLDWPENVWMGVSVEDERVVHRIDSLRKTGAFIKFLSLEPLIGPLPNLNLQGIDWVIAGGESGPKARPMEESWVTDIRDQCHEAGVPFFFKQWGGVNKKKNGRTLEGQTYDEMPA
jgi:protein gp37